MHGSHRENNVPMEVINHFHLNKMLINHPNPLLISHIYFQASTDCNGQRAMVLQYMEHYDYLKVSQHEDFYGT